MEIMSWNNRLKKYFFSEKIGKIDFLLMILAGILILFCFTFRMPFKDAIQSKTKVYLGYCAQSISDDLFYVLDHSHERLLCFDKDSNVIFSIENVSDGNGDLSYIDDFAVTKDGIYISASQWNRMTLGREAILFFDTDGNYVKTLQNRDYSQNKTNKHRFYGVSEYNGQLQYIECLNDSILIGNQEIPYENAFNAVSDAVFVGTTAYILDKDGTIREYSGDDRREQIVFSLLEEERYEIVPYKLAADKDGKLYFTDIKKDKVHLVDLEKENSHIVADARGSLTVELSNTGKFLLVNDMGLHIVDAVSSEEEIAYLELKKTDQEIFLQIIWLIAVIILAVIVIILFFRLVRFLAGIKFSTSKILCFWVLGTAAVVSVILSSLLMNSFAASYQEKIVEQLECAAYMIANQIQPEDIEKIEETGGFGGTSYRHLCKIMERSFPSEIDFYSQIYCNILKLSPDGKTGYAIAYLDQSIGSYFPLDEVETRELQEVYKTGKAIQNNEVADVSGTYLSVKVPICSEKGTIYGAVATGAENYIIEDILQDLTKKIWLSIAIILMLVWLISVEIFSFINNYSFYKKEKTVFPIHMIRPLVFLVFAAYNMTAAFLPVYLLRQSNIFTGKMKEIAGALPITVNIFLIGVMSLFCAQLVKKFGLRKIMIFASGCSLIGNFVIYSFSGFYWTALGLIFDGIGVGLITNAVYVMVTYIKDENNRTWGLRTYNSAYLAGINFGMMFGSILAVNVGQRMVFGIVAVVWLLLIGITWFLISKIIPMLETVQSREEEQKEKKISFKNFIRNKSVLSFIVFIQNPYIIFGSFIFYYVPIFCDFSGLDETICSILIMLYSQVAVLGTDFFTKWISKFCKNYGIYLSLATNLVALMIFSMMPGIKTMIVALILMGISSAFGKPIQQNYYLNLKSVQKYGDDKAIGVYNFTENIGESLGPIVFGKILNSVHFTASSTVFCGGISFLMALHFLISKKEFSDE